MNMEVNYIDSHFGTTYWHEILNWQSDYLSGEGRIVVKRIVSNEGTLLNFEL
jgi:hypothetical protein